MQQIFQSQTDNSVLSELKDQIEKLLLLLSQREKYVIERRFALGHTEKATLEEIGSFFNVTRERVRQIEKNALHKLKRNITTFRANEINDLANKILLENGGLLTEESLLSKILMQMHDQTAFQILFILSLDRRFDRRTNTIGYHPHFKLRDLSDAFLDDIANKCFKLLEKRKDVMDVSEIHKSLSTVQSVELLSQKTLISLFQIYKQFKCAENSVGLIFWKHIHPRTLRDKIFYILRRNKKPLHFVDISNNIIDCKFDNKNVNLQAVHNELIRNNDFILIGRGIYALREWGFNPGTVADVIKDILNEKKELSEEQIISEVLKKRKVKPITIILNLKNNNQFTRIGRKVYSLK